MAKSTIKSVLPVYEKVRKAAITIPAIPGAIPTIPIM